MSLKIRVKNLGILKHAEFSLGDLTIFCGENGTGKTDVMTALYGFLRNWRRFVQVPVSDAQLQRLLTDGVLKIDLAQYVNSDTQTLAAACENYTAQLGIVFAAPKTRFHNTRFSLETGALRACDKTYNKIIASEEGGCYWTFSKTKGSEELTVALSRKQAEINLNSVAETLRAYIGDAVFSNALPNPFILSAERTSAAVFQQLRAVDYSHCPLPIKDQIDWAHGLKDIASCKSFIAKEHPEVLEDFAEIIGGNADITEYGMRSLRLKGTNSLTMLESSSAVRSTADLGLYLRCVAQKGELLMIDLPEIGLHPINQRRIARLFARLINIGVKVFIITHSDYIVKELNTLIMLNHDDKPHLKRIADENGYRRDELIKAAQVKVYMAKEAVLPLEEEEKGRSVFEVDDEIVTLAGINRDDQKRERGQTLVLADIHPRFGIEVDTFDDTIDDMNRIQGDIVWGAE